MHPIPETRSALRVPYANRSGKSRDSEAGFRIAPWLLAGCALALVACAGKGPSGPPIEVNYITETAAIPVEVLHQYHLNMDRAQDLARYDRLAWIATDSIQAFM